MPSGGEILQNLVLCLCLTMSFPLQSLSCHSSIVVKTLDCNAVGSQFNCHDVLIFIFLFGKQSCLIFLEFKLIFIIMINLVFSYLCYAFHYEYCTLHINYGILKYLVVLCIVEVCEYK